MSRASLLDLIPELQPWAEKLLQVCQQADAQPTITSTLRTYAEQSKLYANYLSGHSKYPAARPGTSAHEFGWAFDLSMPSRTNQIDAGTLWRSWGGKWAGEEDVIHFEYPGFTVQKAATVGPELPSSFGRPGTAIEQLVDVLLSWVPEFRIIGTAQLATALWKLSGGSDNLILYWLASPVEFVRDVFSEWRTLLSLIY